MAYRHILMLEGDRDDQFITNDSLKKAGLTVPFHFLESSTDVMPYLDNCNSLPVVIILTMRSVPEDGLAVLKAIKTDEAYRSIPVIMLCEQVIDGTINECYRYGANSVIQKPSSNELTIKKIELFVRYWFEITELPIVNKLEVNY